MGKVSLIAGALVAFICAFSGMAQALSIIDQDPNLAMYENFTRDPMRITFDGQIDTSTVNNATVFITYEGAPAQQIPVAYSFETLSVTDDTLVLTPQTPSNRWPFATRLLLNITTGLSSTSASSFDGQYPFGQTFVANIPEDLDRMADWDPTDPFDFVDAFVNANVLLGFNPVDPENTNTAKPWTIPGMSATEAWKYTAGRPDVIIAVVDSGLESYDLKELNENFFLNQGELPPPNDGGSGCTGVWDCNNDGRFNVRDYDNDSTFASLGRPVTVRDLIDTFSDGTDDDGNGLADDICGWDFLRNVNEALGVREFPEGGHGEDRAKDAAAIAENDNDDKPGFCPNCSILPIRVSDSVMSEFNSVGAGVEYASQMGASVAVMASGSLNYTGEVNRKLTEISEDGLVLIGVTSDELGYHHSFAGSCDDVISVKSIFPIPPIEFLGFFPMGIFGFTETYCTMWGEGVHLAGSSGACSSEAAGNVAGLAGLIVSRARDLGLDLTANEVKQILTMSADDIERYCVTLTGGGCQEGWDAHFGYGRPNAARAFEMLGDPPNGIQPKIPPEVKIRTPRWFSIIDPEQTPTVDVSGYIFARGQNYEWELQVAAGKEPLDGEFVTVATGAGTAALDDVLAAVDISGILPADIYDNPPLESFDFTTTLRLRAWYKSGLANVFGEDRRTIALHRDAKGATGLVPGFPIDLDASGEASVTLYDLDGDPDGRLEIVGTATNGQVYALKYNSVNKSYEPLEGWPVNLADYIETAGNFEVSMSSPAVGDIFGDGIPYVAVATGSGALVILHHDGTAHEGGPLLDGFPVFAFAPDNSSTDSYGHGNSFGGSPVYGDLDGDGILEVVATNFDGHVYAWKATDNDQDGFADFASGFPVFAKSQAGSVPPDKVCTGELTGWPPQILGTPIVGVLDPDSDDPDIAYYPSIFVGTSEVCDGGIKTTRFYGIYHDGVNNASQSPFIPGFPVKLLGPISDALPIPPVTLGITSTPALARHNGKAYIGIASVVWFPQLIEWDNGAIKVHTLPSNISLNLLGHGSFGRLSNDDRLYYILPTTGAVDIIDEWISLLKPVILAWDLDDLSKPAFSSSWEDSNWYANTVVADISGDGMPEMIAGTGGFMVHAPDLTGLEAPDWPKFTNNWTVTAPTVGDLDNDDMLEVLVHTREGNLFAWNTEGMACKEEGFASDWWTFHHDEWNSGVYGLDTQPPGVPTKLRPYYSFMVFNAPGDDWYCGRAMEYDIRVAQTEEELMTLEGFEAAQKLEIEKKPVIGGEEEYIEADIRQYEWLALRAIDEAGNKGWISQPERISDDENDGCCDDDDDDDKDSGDDDDDDDDEGCCGC